jgi:hypothetical protein
MDVLAAAVEAACADPEWRDCITDPPEVRGRQDLKQDDLTIRVQMWVESSAKRQSSVISASTSRKVSTRQVCRIPNLDTTSGCERRRQPDL